MKHGQKESVRRQRRWEETLSYQTLALRTSKPIGDSGLIKKYYCLIVFP
jgi:hypothetical protein